VPRIVFTTTEPFGAYHLEAFAQARQDRHRHYEFLHLLPHLEPVQGEALITPVADLAVLHTGCVLVLCGGGFSPWLELVAGYAAGHGIPLAYVKVSRIDESKLPAGLPVALAVGWGSVDVERFAGVWPTAVLLAAGSPQLDETVESRPEPMSLLVLSTSAPDERDPSRLLPSALATLRREGWSPTVRLHPRETGDTWRGFPVLRGGSLASQIAGASRVVAYDGSLVAVAARHGTPVVCFDPGGTGNLLPSAALPNVAHDLVSLRRMLTEPGRSDRASLDAILGQETGGGVRILDALCALV